jgi:cytoskeleton-associated protein 5
MSFFVDKIGDVKLSVSIKEMLLDMAEIVTPKFICLQVIKYAATTKAPKNIQESCNIITELIENFGIGGIAMKETIDFGKIAAAHATPAIR